MDNLNGWKVSESGFTPLQIALIYGLIGSLWIVGSDTLLSLLLGGSPVLVRWEVFKGCLYVAVTTVLLYVLVNRSINAVRRSASALQESEERYRSLFEDNHTVLLLIDPESGGIVDANPAACEFYGYDREAFKQKTIYDLNILPPEQVTKKMEQARSSRQQSFYLRHRLASGEIRDVEIYTGLIKFHGNDLLHSIIHDVTERKRIEQRLESSEHKFRSVFENANDAILLMRQDVFIDCNPKAEEIFGGQWAEILKRRPCDFSPERQPDGQDSKEAALANINAALNEGSQFFEWRHIRLDGTPFEAEVSLSRIDIDAKPGLQAIIRDVTERKQAEEALERQQELLQTIFDHLPVMVIVFDCDGQVWLVNREWEQTLGWRLAEIKERDIFAEFYPDPQAQQEVRQFIQSARATWREFKTRRRDGRVLNTLWANVQLSDGRTIGIGQDITERKEMEEQLRQAQKMEAIGRLAGGIAHDFNNILTVIGGCTSFLLYSHPDEADPARSDIERIRRATERAADLVRQLLAFSRKQVLRPEIVNLNQVLDQIVKMLRRLIGEDIQLITRPASDLGRVKADPGQIEQIIFNLAVNARDAMPYGGRLIIETTNVELDPAFTRWHPDLAPGPYVLLTVSDTGIGMDANIQSRLFEPFFTTKEVGKGTGLGLASVYGIVKQSGGHIEVASQPGQGASFKIYLPKMDEPVSTRSDQSSPPVPQGSETILLVEDDEMVRGLANRVLSQAGYTVLTTGAGQQALQLGEQYTQPIHLLVTDVIMPGMSGRELADRLTAIRPRLKVLYMSGYTDNIIAQHGVPEKGYAFLQKPFTVDSLAFKIREVLDRPE